jgi:hypothetical protein
MRGVLDLDPAFASAGGFFCLRHDAVGCAEIRIAEWDTATHCKQAGREVGPTLSQPKACSPMLKTSIGRLTGSTTNDTVRIRKLLTFANNCPTTNVFEAGTARTVAYRLISSGLQRGVVDFGDFLDLMPAGIFDCQRPGRGGVALADASRHGSGTSPVDTAAGQAAAGQVLDISGRRERSGRGSTGSWLALGNLFAGLPSWLRR